MSIALKCAISALAIFATCNSFSASPEPTPPVISPIPTELLSATVPLDDMFGMWLRPYLKAGSFNALQYDGISRANEEKILQGASKYCESHGGTSTESGKGTVRALLKCESANSLFTSFRLHISRAEYVKTFTMVDIWDDTNTSFYRKARVSRFEGENRLLVASILLDDLAGVSKAIANGADAKIMTCVTTDNFLAPAGHVDCASGVRNLLGLQLSEIRATYTPIAKALLSAGAKWPTQSTYEANSNTTLSAELTFRSLYQLDGKATTRAEQEAARLERVNVWRDLVKLGLVFDFADLKRVVSETLGDDSADRDFKLRLQGAFANATNQKQKFDQMVAEFEGMDAASLKRKAHREIGDTVCKYERGEVSGVKGIVKTMAFVEDKTPRKLKLRIAGFSMVQWTGTKYYASNNVNLGNDIMSKVNSIIFDDPINWRDDCEKVTR